MVSGQQRRTSIEKTAAVRKPLYAILKTPNHPTFKKNLVNLMLHFRETFVLLQSGQKSETERLGFIKNH